jgi:hypothetical protein
MQPVPIYSYSLLVLEMVNHVLMAIQHMEVKPISELRIKKIKLKI